MLKQKWTLPLGEGNTERKLISIRLSFSTKVKASKREIRKQTVFSNGFTESEAHPPPGPGQRLVWRTKQEKHVGGC